MFHHQLSRIIQQSYKKVPFHGYFHALEVRSNITRIHGKDILLYSMAAELHDAGHGYKSFPEDEIHSCKIAENILSRFGYNKEFIEEVQLLILGTIFRERGNLKDERQARFADADIAAVGGDYDFLLRNFSRFYIETLPIDELPSSEGILKFFQSQWSDFFGYLTGITGNTENPFLCQESVIAFPHFPKNRDTLAFDLIHRKDFLINAIKAEWKHFYGDNLILLDEITI